jgi:hypothetical protein
MPAAKYHSRSYQTVVRKMGGNKQHITALLRVVRKTNLSSRSRGGFISKHTMCLRKNVTAMDPDRVRNQELLH